MKKQTHTFKTSSTENGWTHTFKVEKPLTLDFAEWQKYCANESDVVELAWQQFIVKYQAWLRTFKTPAEAEAASKANLYTYGASSKQQVKILDKDLGWTPEQIAAMEADGTKVILR